MNPIPCVVVPATGQRKKMSRPEGMERTHDEDTAHEFAGLGQVVVLHGGGHQTALFLALFGRRRTACHGRTISLRVSGEVGRN
jgi:hypothetical protein